MYQNVDELDETMRAINADNARYAKRLKDVHRWHPKCETCGDVIVMEGLMAGHLKCWGGESACLGHNVKPTDYCPYHTALAANPTEE